MTSELEAEANAMRILSISGNDDGATIEVEPVSLSKKQETTPTKEQVEGAIKHSEGGRAFAMPYYNQYGEWPDKTLSAYIASLEAENASKDTRLEMFGDYFAHYYPDLVFSDAHVVTPSEFEKAFTTIDQTIVNYDTYEQSTPYENENFVDKVCQENWNCIVSELARLKAEIARKDEALVWIRHSVNARCFEKAKQTIEEALAPAEPEVKS